jgi:hypothetical protein
LPAPSLEAREAKDKESRQIGQWFQNVVPTQTEETLPARNAGSQVLPQTCCIRDSEVGPSNLCSISNFCLMSAADDSDMWFKFENHFP